MRFAGLQFNWGQVRISQEIRTCPQFLLLFSVCLLLAPVAYATDGEIAIYREATATDTITTANFDHNWDTEVYEDAATYSHAAGVADIQLLDAGKYVLLYGARFDTTGGNQRSEVQTQLRLGPSGSLVDLDIGWSQCYHRRSGGSNECLTSGGAIIEASTNDIINLRSFRTDANSAGVQRAADASGIMLLKVDDTWDYLRLGKSGTQTGPTSSTWVDVTYDVQDELDSGTFTHTSGQADITLKTAGHYLIFANTYGATPQTSADRTEVHQRLTLDGSPVEGSETTVYIRGNTNSNDAHEGAASMGIIIETTSSNQVLNVEINRGDGTDAFTINQDGAVTPNTVDRTAVTIAKLPDNADYIRLGDSGTDDINPTTLTALGWNTEHEVDANGFVHPATDSRLEVNMDGHYLFLTSNYAETNGVTRGYNNQGWALNGGSLIQYGQTGRYSRNGGADSAGNWSGIIFDDLVDGNYVEVVAQSLAATGTFPNDSKGVQGVRIASLLPENEIQVGVEGTQVTSAQESDTDVDMVAAFTLLGTLSGTDTVSSITISETGTVDAQNQLSNVTLYGQEEATCTRAGASQIGTANQSFNASQQVTFSGLSITVSDTTHYCIFVELDVGSSAGSGSTVELQISSATDVSSSTTVQNSGFPHALSGTTTIDSDDVTLDTQLTQPANVSLGNTDVVMGAFTLLAEDITSITLSSITVSETGTVDAQNDLSNAHLYSDQEGVCDRAGASSLSGPTSFNASSDATFGSLSLAIDATTPQCIFVELDIDVTANDGDTVEIEVTASGDITFSGGEIASGVTFPVAIAGTTTINTNAAPAIPTLEDTPAFDGFRTADTTPDLGDFYATDSDGDDLEYEIDWDTDYAFGSPTTRISNTHTGFANQDNGGDTDPFNQGDSIRFTVQAGDALSNNTTYYWRVRSRDPSGTNTWSGYSAIRSITINTSLTLDEFYQTEYEQLNAGTVTDLQDSGSDSLEITGW